MDAKETSTLASGASRFSYVRLFGDTDGVTHFEEIGLPLEATGLGPLTFGTFGSCGQLSLLYGTSELDASVFHAAPSRQYFVVIRGAARVTATDGTSRELSAGSVLLLDDIGSAGHATAILTDELVAIVVIV